MSPKPGDMGHPASVVSLLRERQRQEQLRILRLTTPKLHPREQRPLFGDPGTEKRLGPRSLDDTIERWARFEVSHPKRKDKDALRVGHPGIVTYL